MKSDDLPPRSSKAHDLCGRVEALEDTSETMRGSINNAWSRIAELQDAMSDSGMVAWPRGLGPGRPTVRILTLWGRLKWLIVGKA